MPHFGFICLLERRIWGLIRCDALTWFMMCDAKVVLVCLSVGMGLLVCVRVHV
jgi:hypothetical protein